MTSQPIMNKYIEVARMLTGPFTVLSTSLIALLLWVFLDFRADVKEELKINRNFREETQIKLATLQGTCCTYTRNNIGD